MYDALTSTWSFSCPARGGARVALSAFRQLERLPGAAPPAVYRVRFECGCGDEHLGLLSHDDLDWAPLGAGAGTFVNLMTSRSEHAGTELVDVAASRIRAGQWPWSFFCYREGRPRPAYPSSFLLLAPGGDSPRGAVFCPEGGPLPLDRYGKRWTPPRSSCRTASPSSSPYGANPPVRVWRPSSGTRSPRSS